MRVSALLFALLFLISSFTPDGRGTDWLKVPHLLEHYAHHKASDVNSFADFLQMHYACDTDGHSDRHDDHSDEDCLPFQHLNAASVLMLDGSVVYRLTGFTCTYRLVVIPQEQGAELDAFSGSIWQPPKSA
jgi:hypothetical protein